MQHTGSAAVNIENEEGAEMVAVDKSKPADFADDDDDDVDADALAAALNEGQYGDDDLEGDDADAADAADGEEEQGQLDADAEVPDQSVATHRGHKDAVYCVAVSPANPALVASGAGDDSAHLLDLSDPAAPAVLLELAGLTDSVNAVAFSPDGALLAVGVMDGTVHIVDVAAREVLHELSADGDLETLLWQPQAAGSSEPPCLATANSEGLVHLWDVAAGYARKVLSAPRREPVRSLLFLRGVTGPGGAALLLAGSENGTVTLWDSDKGKALATLKGGNDVHQGGVICLAQHPTQPLAVSGAQDGSVHVLSLAGASTGKLSVLARLKEAHRDSVEALTFGGTTGQPLLASASADCVAKVWDPSRNWMLRQTLQHEGGVAAAAWVPALPVLVTAAADGVVRAWDGRDGQRLAALTGHNNAVLAMALAAPAGKGEVRVATGSDDNTVKLWDLSAVAAKAKAGLASATTQK